MKVLVPVKRVIDANIRVRVKSDNSGVETANVKMAMNPFCEIAVEEALRIKEAGNADEVIIMSAGPDKAAETIRTGLAMGGDRGVHVVTEDRLEPLVIAQMIKAVAEKEGCDLVVLACKTDPAEKARGVSLILVETDRPGFQRGRMLSKIGCRAQDTSELFFADLRVPFTNLLGAEGRGFYQLMTELAQERLVQAIRAIASGEAAVEWTLDYALDRKMFGQTLADFQNTQFQLAAMKADLTSQRVFIDRCIELHMAGQLDAVDAAMAKMVSTELQFKVMDQCLQLFGGWGYMTDFPIARAFVDARLGRIGGGSIEVMKQIIAKSMMADRRNARAV